MHRNYFFLNRLIIEANDLLKGLNIAQIFSQEKGTLIIHCSNNSNEKFVEICVVPGSPYLTIKNTFSRAKKNTIDFFNQSVDEKIHSLEIAVDDRIIKFNLEHSEIYFAIRGKFTNVFFSNNEVFIPFKTIGQAELSVIHDEFLNKKFSEDWNAINLHLDVETNYLDHIRKKYPVLGTDIIKEVKSRSNDNSNLKLENILKGVLEEIRISSPCVFADESAQEIKLGFENFKSIPFTEKFLFKNVIEAQNFLLSKKYYVDSRSERLKLIKQSLDREINKISNRLNSLNGILERGSKEAEYNQNGNLLLTNISKIKAGMNNITVDNIFGDDSKIQIALNPKLSPQKNIDYYFEKSKSERTLIAKTQELVKKLKSEFNYLKNLNESVNQIQSVKELEEVMKKLRIKSVQEKEAKDDLSLRFKHYVIEGKYDLYVGKDSKNNDLLTTKFAKQNDYWFHARGASGSHAVLRIHNTKEPVPKSVLKKSASIAAFHSKAKTAGIVPVAFTFKKYVVKKKGDPVGTVHLLREDVLLVKPEIPAGCEYVSSQD
ncbi:MAG: hypothetical protein DAHOPDDO_03069 [Ignavibacteriaceae bacterium]|nr:hypothetical protein [Ignavibacteriaceae bacterium]